MEISPSEPISIPDFSINSPIQIKSMKMENMPLKVQDALVWDVHGIGSNTVDQAYKVSCGGVESYAVVFHTDNGGGTGPGKGIAIIDRTKNTLLGRGLLWIYDSRRPEVKQYPHVSWTKTEGQFVRKGLGLRRLCVLNALSMKYFHLPLSSGNVDGRSFSVWEKLFELGKVDKHENVRSFQGVYFTFKIDQETLSSSRS